MEPNIVTFECLFKEISSELVIGLRGGAFASQKKNAHKSVVMDLWAHRIGAVTVTSPPTSQARDSGLFGVGQRRVGRVRVLVFPCRMIS